MDRASLRERDPARGADSEDLPDEGSLEMLSPQRGLDRAF
jgi:hypothetical protein